ncbi:MAG: hypothetical protein JSS37_06835 [Proteobacteria bacterium]|nr:hypothetical protein [Pseudomonadota bacterium]
MTQFGFSTVVNEFCSNIDQASLLLADSANVGGVGIEVARSTVNRIVSANKKVWNVDIFTVATFNDLPDNVKNNIENSYGEDAAKDVKGLVHNGKVYVIAENNESKTDIEQTPFHEIEGHIVIRKLYGNKIMRIMLGDRGNITPETIGIDSIDRPVSNSESRLIHPTD